MTHASRLHNLAAAEARKRKAKELAKERQKNKNKKNLDSNKTNQNNPTNNLNKKNSHNGTNNVDQQMTHNSDDEMNSNFTQKHRILYTMKLHSKDGIDSLKVIQKTLQDWFKTMKSCVNSIVIYKTNDDGMMVINTHEQISTKLQFLKKFFNGICPRTRAREVWFTARIGFDNNKEEVCDNTRWWYQENRVVM